MAKSELVAVPPDTITFAVTENLFKSANESDSQFAGTAFGIVSAPSE